MDVVSDVAFVGLERCPCMQAHPHTNPTRGESLGQCGRSRKRTGSSRKGEEECVSLSVYFHATLASARLPDHPPMFGERFGVAFCSEFLQQDRRAFDVSEEKRDCPYGEVLPHSPRSSAERDS